MSPELAGGSVVSPPLYGESVAFYGKSKAVNEVAVAASHLVVMLLEVERYLFACFVGWVIFHIIPAW
jgi:hypothetical protein